ncbi:hypothetical protein PC119_g8841 [Phytophthora cactorum]|nr:hypothetical protein PC119_g8841 [Phytophthora cactorum]KAG3055224.1 hypothetical protein PC122_g21781 [Phytophthora cactorum]KAG3162726.1 hypothetical protein C6341_g13164 [Phytophthora cactorum]KAG4040708.1 hypothetical protein PC123_g23754 [Phytophthora cactorum]
MPLDIYTLNGAELLIHIAALTTSTVLRLQLGGFETSRHAALRIESPPFQRYEYVDDYLRRYGKWRLRHLLRTKRQGICYSYAPIASIVEKRWEERLHSTELITVYFISYIPCSFVGSRSWVALLCVCF